MRNSLKFLYLWKMGLKGPGLTMNKEFIMMALVHAVVFTVFQLVGNWIFHFGFTWVYYLVSGILYGVLMTLVDRWLAKFKRK